MNLHRYGWTIWTTGLVWWSGVVVWGQEPPATPDEPAVPPEINEAFRNPDVERYVATFEGESREVFVHRREIVAACEPRPGMSIADIGAGTGLFTRLFAAEVGPTGRVYAVDIAPKFLEHIAESCRKEGIDQVETVLGDDDSPNLKPHSVDLVFICDTYHHFEKPRAMMRRIHDALKPGGMVVLVDFKRIPGESSDWIINHVRAGEEVFTREILEAGFVLKDRPIVPLKENYLLRFIKKD
ncbi:Methyltransferase type 11 [Isosphaera pallida ATCC 43644]|uniref:Methyltransferase type 11 n=1 Tax=Isosphaera pallida (strain ATCC 43644 / DSM 9630 / IS1B) TaxID=575540 RepID=E8R5M1_ISOPI|nr:class I SAM-dependent methyltransferase [Isosphaera pallida]ADV61770.1 Methyltransferase type 11 [Isosphaera pallida ATCC 43644]